MKIKIRSINTRCRCSSNDFIAYFVVLIISSFLTSVCDAYKPVVIIHGVLSGNETMLFMADRIKMLHPETEVFITSKYSGWTSLAPMWQQVVELGNDLMKISARFPDGIHLIGYSQGGLIARSILEQYPEHNVKTFISLSSPQAGQYGTKFLNLFFPALTCKTAYELFYSIIGQHTSVGNYWNDPHEQDLYFSYSKFLPFLNNEIPSIRSDRFKSGITKLDKLVMVGGPDDGVITPWQSSHFGFYDHEENVVDLRLRQIYTNDSIGLKTLDMKGKLHVVERSGVSHYDWHKNVSVIDEIVIANLD